MKQHELVRTFFVASLFTFASLASACGGDPAGADAAPMIDAGPADASPRCAEAMMHSDFTWINANIFQRSCFFSSCHTTANATHAGNLDLTSSKAYTSLVDKMSTEITTKKLVDSSSTSMAECT